MGKSAVITWVVVSIFVTPCFAQPANDFSVAIDSEYRIAKTSKSNTSVIRGDVAVVFSSGDFDGVGPIIKFASNDKFILTKHFSEGISNAGDSCFFAINKANGTLKGPLNQIQFESFVASNRLSPRWQELQHPLESFIWLSMWFVAAIGIVVVIWFVNRNRKDKYRDRSAAQ